MQCAPQVEYHTNRAKTCSLLMKDINRYSLLPIHYIGLRSSSHFAIAITADTNRISKQGRYAKSSMYHQNKIKYNKLRLEGIFQISQIKSPVE